MLPYVHLMLGPAVAWLAHGAGRRWGATGLWPIPVLMGLVLVGLLMLARRVAALAFVAPFCWADDVTVAPVLMAGAIPLLLVPLIGRLPAPRRRVLNVFMFLMLMAYALLPPVAQIVARPTLATVQTTFDNRGICRQSTAYTCGPASAVTCLRVLGIAEREGELGRAALTAPLVGTSMTQLARTVQTRHTAVHPECRYVRAIDELTVPAVVDLTLPKIGGHYVAVLAVSKEGVTVGDPLSGRYEMTREEFMRYWHGTAVTFR